MTFRRALRAVGGRKPDPEGGAARPDVVEVLRACWNLGYSRADAEVEVVRLGGAGVRDSEWRAAGYESVK